MKSGMGGMGVTSPNILVSSHSLAGEYLVEVLLNYYVGWYRCPSQNLFANKYPAVEHNSMTNQFYERFKTRFFISQVLRIALNHDNHQRKLFLYTR